MPPQYQYRTPKPNSGTGSKNKPVKKGTSWVRIILELVFFLGWLFCTGLAGYFVGHTYQLSNPVECPPSSSAGSGGGDAAGSLVAAVGTQQPPPCIKRKKSSSLAVQDSGSATSNVMAIDPKEGYTMEELKRLWSCSHAEGEASQVNQEVFPEGKGLEKTKWKSVLSVEPRAFFSKYLHQYPADTRATQPVVVFSHRPLDHVDKIAEVCKVIDVAVVPDTPGVCVAVTETFHDVASYHMLHADRQDDGTFALTSNSIEGRKLPEERDYAGARALLVEFFKYQDTVNDAVKGAPKFSDPKVTVGILVEDEGEGELFLNSFASARKAGVSIGKFCVFTSSPVVAKQLGQSGVKLIHIKELEGVGAFVSRAMRRHFLQAWLAFSVSFSQNKFTWQSPGTLWFDRPDNIVNANPMVETLWVYKGRNDARSAPFFASFDFFTVTSAERSVHLMHEIVLHYDLVLAWESLDAVVSYRLSENNARYGTTSHTIPPYEVLHTELLAHDPTRIAAAVKGTAEAAPPKVIVVPSEGVTPAQAKAMLQGAGLWYL
jgi:hypothetical protein